MLFNRDLNLLCRIQEMRQKQIIAQEERWKRFKKMRTANGKGKIYYRRHGPLHKWP